MIQAKCLTLGGAQTKHLKLGAIIITHCYFKVMWQDTKENEFAGRVHQDYVLDREC